MRNAGVGVWFGLRGRFKGDSSLCYEKRPSPRREDEEREAADRRMVKVGDD